MILHLKSTSTPVTAVTFIGPLNGEALLLLPLLWSWWLWLPLRLACSGDADSSSDSSSSWNSSWAPATAVILNTQKSDWCDRETHLTFLLLLLVEAGGKNEVEKLRLTYQLSRVKCLFFSSHFSHTVLFHLGTVQYDTSTVISRCTVCTHSCYNNTRTHLARLNSLGGLPLSPMSGYTNRPYFVRLRYVANYSWRGALLFM